MNRIQKCVGRNRMRSERRPRLECLEHRTCPSSNNLFENGTLLILGSRFNDAIAIRDDGGGKVTVQSGESDPQSFVGVRRIIARTDDGDDRINYQTGNPDTADALFNLGDGDDTWTEVTDYLRASGEEVEPPNVEPLKQKLHVIGGRGDDRLSATLRGQPDNDVDFRFDSGDGNDFLIIDWRQDEGEVPTDSHGWDVKISVAMGRGDDSADLQVSWGATQGLDVGQLSPRTIELDPMWSRAASQGLDVRADLGGDNDKFQALLICPVDTQVRPTGDDNDKFQALLIPIEQFQRGLPPVAKFSASFNVLGNNGADEIGFIVKDGRIPEGGVLNLNAQGGNGADAVSADHRDLEIDGHVNTSLKGGIGDDIAKATFQGVTVNGMMRATLEGQDGADHIGFNSTWQVNGGGNTEVNLLGGHGIDEVAGFTQNHIAVGGLSVVNLDGGANDDVLSFHYENALVNGKFRIVADGGAGRDQIDVRIDLELESRGRVVANLLGGGGDDELGLAAVGLSDPDDFEAFLDGGAGRDRAGVTRKVLAVADFQSVEGLFLIE